jgi:hypothetical protein
MTKIHKASFQDAKWATIESLHSKNYKKGKSVDKERKSVNEICYAPDMEAKPNNKGNYEIRMTNDE